MSKYELLPEDVVNFSKPRSAAKRKLEEDGEEEGYYRHKGWHIHLKIVNDGWLYCLFPPTAKCGDQYLWATTSLKEARDYINELETD